MPEKLDREKILRLLAVADTMWFSVNPGPMDYRKHWEFVADYIVKNYKKEARK